MSSGRERVERRLAAILPADAAGYSRLMGEDEEGTHSALTALRHVPAISFKVASCAHLGRMNDAREALNLLLELRPGLTVARMRLLKLAPKIGAVYREGLRKAGLPE